MSYSGVPLILRRKGGHRHWLKMVQARAQARRAKLALLLLEEPGHPQHFYAEKLGVDRSTVSCDMSKMRRELIGAAITRTPTT